MARSLVRKISHAQFSELTSRPVTRPTAAPCEFCNKSEKTEQTTLYGRAIYVCASPRCCDLLACEEAYERMDNRQLTVLAELPIR